MNNICDKVIEVVAKYFKKMRTIDNLMSMNVTNLVERNGAVNEWKRVISGVCGGLGDYQLADTVRV